MTTNALENQKTSDIVQELQKENLDGSKLKKLLDTKQEKILLVNQLTQNNENFMNALKPHQEKICALCKDIAKNTQNLIPGSPEFAVMYLYTALTTSTTKDPNKEQVLSSFNDIKKTFSTAENTKDHTKIETETSTGSANGSDPSQELWESHPDLYQENNPQFGTLTDDTGKTIATGRIDFYDKDGNIIDPKDISSGGIVPMSLLVSGGKDFSGFLSESATSFTQHNNTISFFNGQENRTFTFKNDIFPRIPGANIQNKNTNINTSTPTEIEDQKKQTQPSSHETNNVVNLSTKDNTTDSKTATDNQDVDSKETKDAAPEAVDRSKEIIQEATASLNTFWEIKNFIDDNPELSQTIEKITSNISDYELAEKGQETKKEGYKTEALALIKQLNSLDVSKIRNPQISDLITAIKNYTFDPNRELSSNITSLSVMASKSLKVIHDYNNSYSVTKEGILINFGESYSSFIQADGSTSKNPLIDLGYGNFSTSSNFKELRAIKNPEFTITVSKPDKRYPQVITRIYVKEKQ